MGTYYPSENGEDMSVKLLDQTRKISKLLHDNSSKVVIFSDICACVGELLSASCMVISAKGKVLGTFVRKDAPNLTELLSDEVGDMIDSSLNERFLSVLSTKEDVNLQTLGFGRIVSRGIAAILLPVYFAGDRMGTTFIFRRENPFDVEDIILSEYANTVIELEIMRAIYEEDDAKEREASNLSSALLSLSQSETKALECLVREMKGVEGDIIASKIAEKYGITRSIIVNALRKMEGAGVLETKSMGMRGTHIHILNETLLQMYGKQETTRKQTKRRDNAF